MLKKNNIEVWLEDEEGNVLPHGQPTTNDNEISATVEIAGGKASVSLSILLATLLKCRADLRCPLASSPWIQAHFGLERRLRR
jgi:hypothetical protein